MPTDAMGAPSLTAVRRRPSHGDGHGDSFRWATYRGGRWHYALNARLTTFTLSGTPPAWECYPGAVWTFAGNNPTIFNGAFSTISCSGNTLTTIGPQTPEHFVSGGTASLSYNPRYYFDGTHPSANFNVNTSTQDSAAILAAQGRMKKCTTITKQIPWQVLGASQATTSALTQTIPLLQLFPGWSVCSVRADVQTAFTGGFATLTMSIGDSNGTATQYGAAGNIMATGQAVPPNNNPTVPTTANGMVQLNFISTVATLTR